MQRAVAANVGRFAKPAALGGAGISSTAQCRAPSTDASASQQSPVKNTAFAVEEVFTDDEEWSHIETRGRRCDPTIKEEIAEAFRDICASVGSVNEPSHSRPKAHSEGDISDISDSTQADLLFASAETNSSTSQLIDALDSIVSNLLENEHVSSTVMKALRDDPSFQSIVNRYGIDPYAASSNTPPMLALTPYAWPPSRNSNNALDVIGSLISGLFERIGQGVCLLGNTLRKLPEDIQTLFECLCQQHAERFSYSPSKTPLHEERKRNRFKEALVRVALVLVIAIFARRTIRIRFA